MDQALAIAPSEAQSRAAQTEAWMHEHGSAVLRLAYSFLLDWHQAEDVFQEVFLRAYQRAPALAADKVRPWLLQVTANRCKDLRRNAWWRRVTLKPESPERRGEDGALNPDPTLEAVLALPADYRTVISLYYFDGYKTKEIAEILGVKEGTVTSRLHRGRQQLKDYLEKMGVEP